MFVDDGRKPEYPEKAHTSTGRTCKLHTKRSQAQAGMRSGNLLAAKATVLTTDPLCNLRGDVILFKYEDNRVHF